MTPLLSINGVTLRFGGLAALKDVSFTVAAGEIVALIGPNGAGKTSLFNVVTGLYRPQHGQVLVAGREPRRPFATLAWLSVMGAALATGIGLALFLNANTLWDAAITVHFRWQQPFPWSVAFGSAWTALVASPAWWQALVGAVLGGAGAATVLARGRTGPEVATKAGVARTFQNIRLFKSLSVRENLRIALDRRCAGDRSGSGDRSGFGDLSGSGDRSSASVGPAASANSTANVNELLDFVGLHEAAERRAGDLPYGHQRRLEIARALALGPQLLLLDEPAAGMNPAESHSLMELLCRIRASGITILLIEHDMAVVMGISDRVVVLNFGTVIASGTPAEVRRHPAVISAYLGAGHDGSAHA
ncbi:hypothetical protein LBMAG53_14340 [Planctomycetota bacterium]|nr:hypothetical protein LBMAG53_14340 [Planctomycetota bacterium]